MKTLQPITLAFAIFAGAPVMAANLVTTGESIDVTGTTLSIAPTGFSSLNNMSHNGGGSFTIDTSPANNDFYITYSNSNVNPETFRYLQIDFAAGITETSTANFQLYMANGNTYAGGDLNFNGLVTPTASAFSLLFDMNDPATGTTWTDLASGQDIDGVRLDTFNGAAFRGATFTISAITFGDTLIPEPSSTLLTSIAGLFFLLARHRA